MSKVDLVIAGSDMAAWLLAGQLALAHNKRVALVADLSVPVRLAREIWLDFMFATRPESWEFVSKSAPEAHKLIAQAGGRKVLSQVAPLVIASTSLTNVALTHMLQMGRYYGFEMEQVAGGQGEPDAIYRIRGVRAVRNRLMWPQLMEWVRNAGVSIVPAGSAGLTGHRNGSVRLEGNEQVFEADMLVLSDSASLMRHGHRGDVRQHLATCWGSALLTEPADVSEPLVIDPGHDFSARQQGNGTLGLLASRPAAEIGAIAQSSLGAGTGLRRAGQTEFRHLVSRDGAPVIGRYARSGAWVSAGWGQFGLFAVPAVARLLVDQATAYDAAFLTPRQPGALRSDAIAEFAGERVLAEAES